MSAVSSRLHDLCGSLMHGVIVLHNVPMAKTGVQTADRGGISSSGENRFKALGTSDFTDAMGMSITCPLQDDLLCKSWVLRS